MTIIYRSTGAWGPGQGSDLSAAQIDGNFYDLATRVDTLETSPPEAVSISTIDVTGNLMTITLTDASTLGPFVLPATRFRWMGAWQAGIEYAVNDVFSYDLSIYAVLVDHTSAATFDALRFDSVGFYYQELISVPDAFMDIGFFYPGVPSYGINLGDPMLAFRVTRDFYLPASLLLSQAGFGYPATHEIVLNIMKNDVQQGTWSSLSGFTWASDVQFTAGDVLSIELNEALWYDETARDLTITLAGIRGLVPA